MYTTVRYGVVHRNYWIRDLALLDYLEPIIKLRN